MNQHYEKDKLAKIIGILFIVCACLFIGIVYWLNARVKVIDVSSCQLDTNNNITYDIDSISYKFNYIQIKGYAYQNGISVDTADTKLLAYDESSDTFYELPTENVKREDITEALNDGFNYDYSGFQTIVYKDKIIKGSHLWILYRCNGTNVRIDTGEVLN